MDFIATLEKCLGQAALKEYCPMQAGDVYQTYADVSELMQDFDFKPTPRSAWGWPDLCSGTRNITKGRHEHMKIAVAGTGYVGLSMRFVSRSITRYSL